MKTRNVLIMIASVFLVVGLSYMYSYTSASKLLSKHAMHLMDKHYTMLNTRIARGYKPGFQYKLLDIKELYVRSNQNPEQNTRKKFKILNYNAVRNIFNDASDNQVIRNECVYTNCEVTSDLNEISKSDAVIFHLLNDRISIMSKPPKRKPGQVWVLSNTSPKLSSDLDIPAIETTWKNSINWTMSYRFDSDILWSHGKLRTRRIDEFPNKDYYVTTSYRNRKVMVIITDCDSYKNNGLKEHIATLSSRLSITIDIYGVCEDTRPLTGNLKEIVHSYLFLMIFEDYNCPQLVTKTLFDIYDLDIFTVVHGSSDYNDLLPDDVFLNLANYETLDEKVKILFEFFWHVEQAVELQRRKDLYVTMDPVRWQCDLCQKLNNKGDNQHVYDSLTPVLERYVCEKRIFN